MKTLTVSFLKSATASKFTVDNRASSPALDRILAALETYKGRDRFLRLLTYSSKCAAGLIKSPVRAEQFDNFSKQLSASRACFRLLDDVPTITEIIRSGQSKEEGSQIYKVLLRFESILDLIFNPLDHISWAIEHRIIASNSTIWDIASTWCWVISLYLNIYKIILKLSKLSEQKMETTAKSDDRESRKNLSAKQRQLKLSALKCTTDLLFAVNYLPKGILWAKLFSKWQVGALGSFSSIIALYQALML